MKKYGTRKSVIPFILSTLRDKTAHSTGILQNLNLSALSSSICMQVCWEQCEKCTVHSVKSVKSFDLLV